MDFPETLGLKLEDCDTFPQRINLEFTPGDKCKADGNCTISVKGMTKKMEFNLSFIVDKPEEVIGSGGTYTSLSYSTSTT